MEKCEPFSVRDRLKAAFDRVLAALGFKHTASTWLREDSGITLGINTQRWPMLDIDWINYQLLARSAQYSSQTPGPGS